jgi:protein-S-isoprenylcysteine O-methyltransferase Ste14
LSYFIGHRLKMENRRHGKEHIQDDPFYGDPAVHDNSLPATFATRPGARFFALRAGSIQIRWHPFYSARRGTPAPIDPPKELVVRGLYRYVRNPMYVGVLSVLIGEALLFESARLFWYGAAVFLLFNLFVILYEEPALGRKFGKSYQDYRAAVGRWLPRNFKSRG